ncbi:hypothetical protein Tco_0711620 [Tanacetum coccineum]
MKSYLASKLSGVGYDTKSLLEQLRETYVNDDYDQYDDDMYEGQNIPDNIQFISDNLDSKLRGFHHPFLPTHKLSVSIPHTPIKIVHHLLPHTDATIKDLVTKPIVVCKHSTPNSPFKLLGTTDNPVTTTKVCGIITYIEENKALKGGTGQRAKANLHQKGGPELIRMYGYQSTDEYYADYDYWNTWVQDESTDEEDEDEVMTTKDDDLLFYQDTFPVDKFVHW